MLPIWTSESRSSSGQVAEARGGVPVMSSTSLYQPMTLQAKSHVHGDAVGRTSLMSFTGARHSPDYNEGQREAFNTASRTAGIGNTYSSHNNNNKHRITNGNAKSNINLIADEVPGRFKVQSKPFEKKHRGPCAPSDAVTYYDAKRDVIGDSRVPLAYSDVKGEHRFATAVYGDARKDIKCTTSFETDESQTIYAPCPQVRGWPNDVGDSANIYRTIPRISGSHDPGPFYLLKESISANRLSMTSGTCSTDSVLVSPSGEDSYGYRAFHPDNLITHAGFKSLSSRPDGFNNRAAHPGGDGRWRITENLSDIDQSHPTSVKNTKSVSIVKSGDSAKNDHDDWINATKLCDQITTMFSRNE